MLDTDSEEELWALSDVEGIKQSHHLLMKKTAGAACFNLQHVSLLL